MFRLGLMRFMRVGLSWMGDDFFVSFGLGRCCLPDFGSGVALITSLLRPCAGSFFFLLRALLLGSRFEMGLL